MLLLKIPEYEKDITKITKYDCYMYGLLLGDGSMTNTSTTSYISLNSETKKDIKYFVEEYLSRKFVKYFITKENNTTRIRWNKSISLPFRYQTLYNLNKEKHIHNDWLNLPLEKAQYIVKGLIDTDGCLQNEITFDTTSKSLLDGLCYILLRMGIPTSGYVRNRIGEYHITKYGDRIENKKISYCLRIPKTNTISTLLGCSKGKFYKFFKYKNYIYTRITGIEKSSYTGTLYDLQLRKTHNYQLSNCIVHNGGGKRKGSIAIYIEPWHADIRDFLDLRKNHGDENARARDLFYAMWIPDLFMHKVEKNENWHYFVLMNVQDYQIHMVKNLILYMRNMYLKKSLEKQFQQEKFGKQLLYLK